MMHVAAHGWRTQYGVIGIILVASGALGFGLVAFSAWIIAAVILIFLLCGFLLVRIWAQGILTKQPVSAESYSYNRKESPDVLELPRFMYYLATMLSGVLILRPILGLTASDLIFYAAFMVTVILLLLSKQAPKFAVPRLMVLGIVMFAVGSLDASVASSFPVASIVATAKFIYLITVWLWLGVTLLDRSDRFRRAVMCWVVGMALSGGLAIVQANGFGTFWSDVARYGRFTGGGDHPNDLGAQTALAIVPALFLLTSTSSRRSQVVAGGSFIFLFAGAALSGSVLSMLTICLCVGAWLACFATLSIRAVLAAAFVVVLFAVGIFLISGTGYSSPLDRLDSTINAQGEYCTACSRLSTNSKAITAIVDSPLRGRGLDPVSGTVDGKLQVHQILLKAWYESGLLGLVGLISVLSSITGLALANVRHARDKEQAKLALVLLISLMAFAVIGMGQPVLFQRYAWFPLAFIVVQWSITRRSVGLSSTHQVDAKRPILGPSHHMPGLLHGSQPS